MRSYTLLVALALAGCGSSNAMQTGDDTPIDAAPDAPGPGCWGLSPRTTPAESFVGPTGLQTRLTQLIDGAQQKLDVQMYLFTVTALADRIVAAKNRGVAVRVILDPDEAGNANVRTKLVQASIPTRDAASLYTFSHAKYFVIDGKTAVIMSMNLNIDAMNNERNYGLVTRDLDDVSDTQAIFNMDWALAGGEPPMPADLACTRLVVSPNNAKQRVLDFINSAKTTLDVETMYISEQTVRDAIVAAKDRGVAVRVILEGASDDNQVRAYFTSKGITTKYANQFFLHAKLIIADGVAFVGSENYSITSLTKNRELGAFVFEPASAQTIQQQFDVDWTSGSN